MNRRDSFGLNQFTGDPDEMFRFYRRWEIEDHLGDLRKYVLEDIFEECRVRTGPKMMTSSVMCSGMYKDGSVDIFAKLSPDLRAYLFTLLPPEDVFRLTLASRTVAKDSPLASQVYWRSRFYWGADFPYVFEALLPKYSRESEDLTALSFRQLYGELRCRDMWMKFSVFNNRQPSVAFHSCTACRTGQRAGRPPDPGRHARVGLGRRCEARHASYGSRPRSTSFARWREGLGLYHTATFQMSLHLRRPPPCT